MRALFFALLVSSSAFAETLTIKGRSINDAGWSESGTVFWIKFDSAKYAFDARTQKPVPFFGGISSQADSKGAEITMTPVGGEWRDGAWQRLPVKEVTLAVSGSVVGKWAGEPSEVHTFFSPDSKRLAWVIRPVLAPGPYVDRRDRSQDSWIIVLSTAGAPRVRVTAEKAISDKAIPALYDALEKAAAVVTGTDQALKARATSVVYAAEGQEDFAATVAKAIPGGATVEKLTWQTEAEVVVAAGNSVLGGAK